ncbi:MAG: hypothetical protein UIM53_02830 [Acutalibacteraceae bacterium]|nr:hypothetical protein [Acutalibacteraceae bacterium]
MTKIKFNSVKDIKKFEAMRQHTEDGDCFMDKGGRVWQIVDTVGGKYFYTQIDDNHEYYSSVNYAIFDVYLGNQTYDAAVKYTKYLRGKAHIVAYLDECLKNGMEYQEYLNTLNGYCEYAQLEREDKNVFLYNGYREVLNPNGLNYNTDIYDIEGTYIKYGCSLCLDVEAVLGYFDNADEAVTYARNVGNDFLNALFQASLDEFNRMIEKEKEYEECMAEIPF